MKKAFAWRLSIGCALLGLGLGLPAVPAVAADDPLGMIVGEVKSIGNLPSPWPLRNLIKDGVLTVGTTGASPPRTFIDPATTKLTGIYVDLFAKLAEDLGLDVEFVQVEWAGILPGLAANRFDIACDGAAWTPERLTSDQFLMSAPTGTVGLALKSSGITTFEEAKGHMFGGVRGEAQFRDVQQALEGSPSMEFPGIQEALLGLQSGQVEMIALHTSAAFAALESAPNRDDLVVVGPALKIYAQGLCINPREPDLLVAVNALLGNYRSEGTLAGILGNYTKSTAEVDLLKSVGY